MTTLLIFWMWAWGAHVFYLSESEERTELPKAAVGMVSALWWVIWPIWYIGTYVPIVREFLAKRRKRNG